jgi:hypothetical protein
VLSVSEGRITRKSDANRALADVGSVSLDLNKSKKFATLCQYKTRKSSSNHRESHQKQTETKDSCSRQPLNMAPTPNISLKTALAGASREKIIASLHDHQNFLKVTNDQLQDAILQDGTPGTVDSKCTYEIHSKGQSPYKQIIMNEADGIISDVNMSVMGGSLQIVAHWKIIGDDLVENVFITANFLIRKAVEGPTKSFGVIQGKKLVDSARA